MSELRFNFAKGIKCSFWKNHNESTWFWYIYHDIKHTLWMVLF